VAIEVTTRDTESGETRTVVLQPGQFVVCCAEPAHVVSDVAYVNGKNNVWIKRRREDPPKSYKKPRGTCPVCCATVPVNLNGGLRNHDNPRRPGTFGWPGRCPGSHQPPAALADPAAVAPAPRTPEEG
jgi:hypothetical protein